MPKLQNELNLSNLAALLRMSKSLVFVPDRATAKTVRKVCHSLGLPQWTSGEGDSNHVIPFERNHENFASICVLPAMTTGWHSLAEQVIWIGPVSDVVQYMQAMARVSGKKPAHTLENWGAL